MDSEIALEPVNSSLLSSANEDVALNPLKAVHVFTLSFGLSPYMCALYCLVHAHTISWGILIMKTEGTQIFFLFS